MPVDLTKLVPAFQDNGTDHRRNSRSQGKGCDFSGFLPRERRSAKRRPRNKCPARSILASVGRSAGLLLGSRRTDEHQGLAACTIEERRQPPGHVYLAADRRRNEKPVPGSGWLSSLEIERKFRIVLQDHPSHIRYGSGDAIRARAGVGRLVGSQPRFLHRFATLGIRDHFPVIVGYKKFSGLLRMRCTY